MAEPTFTLPAISAEDTIRGLAAGTLRVLDLRKTHDVAASGQRLADADIRDPMQFSHSDAFMTHDGPIAVFCAHGHHVSQFGTALLMVHGSAARYVSGGFAALLAADAQTRPLTQDDPAWTSAKQTPETPA